MSLLGMSVPTGSMSDIKADPMCPMSGNKSTPPPNYNNTAYMSE